MRIISGTWRSRPLIAPKGDTTRPTADRTRETLFSMLTSRLGSFEGLQVLDLFSGSGALGLEALSRGAAHCVFVEQDKATLDALESNISKLGARGLMRFFRDESCGQCTPCRSGTAKALTLIEPPRWDTALLADLSQVMRDASICGLGQAAPNPVDCVMRYFAQELEP